MGGDPIGELIFGEVAGGSSALGPPLGQMLADPVSLSSQGATGTQLGRLFGAGVAYLVLIGAGVLGKRLSRRAAKGARGYLRLVLSNLGGPGSLAPVVAPALGLGLALMSKRRCRAVPGNKRYVLAQWE